MCKEYFVGLQVVLRVGLQVVLRVGFRVSHENLSTYAITHISLNVGLFEIMIT